jgi:RNA polymerase sigma-70 factor, ECF subfamily
MPNLAEQSDQFVTQLIAAQRGLYAYIFRMIPNESNANDILQETNAVLLQKRHEFQETANFSPWARKIAYFQILSFRLKSSRELICFDIELIEKLSEGDEDLFDHAFSASQALDSCRRKLKAADQSLLALRYEEELSVGQIAESQNRSAQAISQCLHRVRSRLLDCIRRTISVWEKA